MRAAFVLNAAIFCSFALAFADDRCPVFSSKKPFDAAKFAGVWHNLVYIDHPTHTGPMKCGKVEVSHSKNAAGKDTLSYKYDYIENGKRNIAYKISQAINPESPASLQSVWRLEGETTWSSSYDSSIIATDYDNYAVEALCAYYYIEPQNTFVRSYYAQVLSRKPTLPPETLKSLKEIIMSYDVAPSAIKELDNTNCSN